MNGERESLFRLADLKHDGDEWITQDAIDALVEAVEAAREVVWRRQDDGQVVVVSGLVRLETSLRRFV